MKDAIIQKIKGAPTEPGVYTFYQGNKVLYIGKAANLKNRLKSYLKITDIKTEMLHEEADRLEYVILNSEIEALIEESRLIKERKPKLNVLWMDDKTYSYVYFTKEKFPKILLGHQNLKARLAKKLSATKIGPFTDGGMLRTVMKILRRPFPYCTCMQSHLRDCLNAQIGKCLGACCSKATSRQPLVASRYLKNIRAIKAILTGKKTLKNISDEKEQSALNKIQEHRDFVSTSESKPEELDISSIKKVECYDNSNFAGKEAVGAMTALVKTDFGWQSDKNSYRKFKIKNTPTRDDPRMIGEILERRINHLEWPFPDLIIIDGGVTQYNAAKKVLSHHPEASSIKLVSYAKPQKRVIGVMSASKELRELIERAIYQTHNFVIRFHRQVRSKEFIPRK